MPFFHWKQEKSLALLIVQWWIPVLSPKIKEQRNDVEIPHPFDSLIFLFWEEEDLGNTWGARALRTGHQPRQRIKWADKHSISFSTFEELFWVKILELEFGCGKFWKQWFGVVVFFSLWRNAELCVLFCPDWLLGAEGDSSVIRLLTDFSFSKIPPRWRSITTEEQRFCSTLPCRRGLC